MLLNSYGAILLNAYFYQQVQMLLPYPKKHEKKKKTLSSKYVKKKTEIIITANMLQVCYSLTFHSNFQFHF